MLYILWKALYRFIVQLTVHNHRLKMMVRGKGEWRYAQTWQLAPLELDSCPPILSRPARAKLCFLFASHPSRARNWLDSAHILPSTLGGIRARSEFGLGPEIERFTVHLCAFVINLRPVQTFVSQKRHLCIGEVNITKAWTFWIGLQQYLWVQPFMF